MADRENYGEIIRNEQSLELFLQQLGKFNTLFCDHMADGDDFTLRIEVHGDKGQILHVRTSDDGFKRPSSDAGKNLGKTRRAV